MSKQPKELRIPIMMSVDEVGAIDTWRFANRIATRAEAVRRLCQTGLGLDAEGEELCQSAASVLESTSELAAVMADQVQENDHGWRKLLSLAEYTLITAKSNYDTVVDYFATAAYIKIETGDKKIVRFDEVYDSIKAHRNSMKG